MEETNGVAEVVDDEQGAGAASTFDVSLALSDKAKPGRLTTITLFDDAPAVQVDVVKLSDAQIGQVWAKHHYDPNAKKPNPVAAAKVVKEMIAIRVKGMRGFTADGKLVFAFPDGDLTPWQIEQNKTALYPAFDASLKDHREIAVKVLYQGKVRFRDEVQNLWNVTCLREQDEEALIEKN